jgi:hypothetical protein
MTRTEHLLTALVEESAAVTHGVTKALRFGLHEFEPGQPGNHADRLHAALQDFTAVAELLRDAAALPRHQDRSAINAKKAQLERSLEYAARWGTLEEVE